MWVRPETPGAGLVLSVVSLGVRETPGHSWEDSATAQQSRAHTRVGEHGGQRRAVQLVPVGVVTLPGLLILLNMRSRGWGVCLGVCWPGIWRKMGAS